MGGACGLISVSMATAVSRRSELPSANMHLFHIFLWDIVFSYLNICGSIALVYHLRHSALMFS